MILPDCPDPELLAACAEGRLHGAERERVLRHLTSCHDCYAVFTEALRFLEEQPAVEAAAQEGAAEPVKAPDAAADAPARERAAPLGQPGPGETPRPTPSPAGPRDNIIPFDRRRWRRVATVALPLAAAAALAVVVMQQAPQPPAAPPVTLAQAPSPQSTPAATASPLADAAAGVRSLAMRELLPLPPARMAFDAGQRGLDGRCLYAALMSVDIEVARAHDPPEAARRVRTAAAVIRASGASEGDELSTHFQRLAADARAGRLAEPADLRPKACPAALLDAARTVELVRLAAVTRDAELLRHPEVAAGLSAGARAVPADDRQAFEELARLAATPPLARDITAWNGLKAHAQDLAARWLP